MRKSVVFLIIFVCFLLLGCQKETVTDRQSPENKEIENLVIQVQELQKEIKELKESVVVEETPNVNEQLSTQIFQIEHLLKNLPNVTDQLGYIEEINNTDSQVTFNIRFVEMKNSSEGPNDYEIENKEIGSLEVKSTAEFFILNELELEQLNSVEELSAKLEDYERLFHFYIIDDQIVMVSEQYLP